MDIAWSRDERNFQEEVRAFLAENLTDEIRALATLPMPGFGEYAELATCVQSLLQRLGSERVDLDAHLLDAAAQFGVLGTKVVELP